jgi:hypothetical protein
MKKIYYFKPTLKKIIFSSLIVIVWIFMNYISTRQVICDCYNLENTKKCEIMHSLLIIKKTSCCECSSIINLVYQYTLFIIVPFIIAYLTYSIIFISIKNYNRIKH